MSKGDSCDHQTSYYGVINISINENTIGSIDVWRCGVCKGMFCEEKQLGIEAIADTIGMPEIAGDERWAVSVCRLQKGKDKWKLVKLKDSTPLQHECLDEKMISLKVAGYKIDDADHWSFPVDGNVNKAVEIQNGP